jgi:hypothetical protein
VGRRGVRRPGRRARPRGVGVPDPAPAVTLGERGSPSLAGGYRLVRVLGEGEHGVVHLGQAGSSPVTGAAAAAAGGAATGAAAGPTGAVEVLPLTAAVKIHRESVPPERVDREIQALDRVTHPHALHLDDLATLPDGRVCLVFERVGGRGLGRLVAETHEISAGEAVTILAPIVDAVHALHAGGVAHGRIRLSNVLFRDDGAPVLVGFGHATVFPPGASAAALASNPAVLQDRRQLATLVRSVLDRVAGESAEALAQRVVDEDVEVDDFATRLADALFELAPPRPVRFVRTDTRPVAPRIVREAAPVVLDRAPSQNLEALDRLLERARPALDRARAVRPRVWLVAGGVLVSLVAATAVLPANDSARLDASPLATPPGPVPSGDAAPDGGDAEPDAPADDNSTAPDPRAGDDPVAALGALLRHRERCVRELSVLCLDGALQAGSVAMQSDADLVRSVQGGGELPADVTIVAQAPVLLERLGDSALVGLGDVPQTQPASVLMMRSEAGWRIRNYLFR